MIFGDINVYDELLNMELKTINKMVGNNDLKIPSIFVEVQANIFRTRFSIGTTMRREIETRP